MIGMTVQEIAKIPERICVAAGRDKAEAIRALLVGGYITTLVTDEATARDVLSAPPPKRLPK
jgi:dihydroxyacetone kinase-like protein